MKKSIAFVQMLVLVLCLAGCGKESASIGIIGGADGPTAVFITSNVSPLGLCVLAAVIAGGVLAVYRIFRSGKKK